MPLGVVVATVSGRWETYLRIDADCADRSVVLVCTLDRPDRKVLPLVFLADAARALGARRVGLVAPSWPTCVRTASFARQAVTSRTFARLLSACADWLVTIDPHLHRYHALSDIYGIPSRVVHAAPAPWRRGLPRMSIVRSWSDPTRKALSG